MKCSLELRIVLTSISTSIHRFGLEDDLGLISLTLKVVAWWMFTFVLLMDLFFCREEACEVLFEQDNEEISLATMILDSLIKVSKFFNLPLKFGY